MKYQEKYRVQSTFGEHRHLRQRVDNGIVFRLKSSLNHRKQLIGRKLIEGNELVKHMSDLPGYLQQVKIEKNLQEKALNFGVLDWENLENWKHNQKHVGQKNDTNMSSSRCSSLINGSDSLFNRVQDRDGALWSKEATKHCSHLNFCHGKGLSQGVKQSSATKQNLAFETAPMSSLDGQQKLFQTHKPLDQNYSAIMLEGDSRKYSDKKITSIKETSSLDTRKRGSSLAMKDKISDYKDDVKQREDGLQTSEFNVAHKHCPGKHEGTCHILPEHTHKKNCLEISQPSEFRILFDGKLTDAKWKSFSHDLSSKEVHSAELHSDTSHAFPLPVVETNAESDMKPCIVSAQRMELLPDSSSVRPCSDEAPTLCSKGVFIDGSKQNKPSNSDEIETSKKFDRETAEPTVAKMKCLSPNRWFSSLSRISKTFSFRKSRAVSRFNSLCSTVKSVQMTAKASDCLNNIYRCQADIHCRTRSCPLKRLLSPLVKYKSAKPHLCSENVRLLDGNSSCSTSKSISSSKDKRHKPSETEAILQLTMKNGLPLFKFVADKNSDILAATVKHVTSWKDDPTLIYAFYSVEETKCGCWTHQEQKEKDCGFDYNLIGQMKVSSSCFPDFTAQSFKDQSAVKEYVLYGVDPRQMDQLTPDFMPNRELAAIVIKIPNENSDKDGKRGYINGDITRKSFTECTKNASNSYSAGENGNSSGITVILPGGVHGLPDKGVPSPLINRWRSGGSCDCGGWDVGCKLQIVTNLDQSCKYSRSFMPGSTTDRLNLFTQGGAEEDDRPIFSLASFKNGIYLVDFNTSMSLLQAFSICVAIVSCQKSSDVTEMNNQTEVWSERNRSKTLTKGQVEVLAKYVPSPSLSPIERI